VTPFSPELGEIVLLKSDGPKMTVIAHIERGHWCQYFDHLGQCHTTYFLTENLVPVSIDADRHRNPTPDRSGEADETRSGSAEGESGLPKAVQNMTPKP
jgi:uncharacterized protein YodC (DUF2158 family)